MICRYIASLTDDLSFYIEMYLLNGLLLLNYVMLFEKLHLRAIKPSILLRKKKKKVQCLSYRLKRISNICFDILQWAEKHLSFNSGVKFCL